ncbi:MAG: hypothetical protein EOQ39_35325 [Mesorhizobium sp.]|uniref:PIN domain-containing protein n=1 Tax=Mesorhizobium sp. TaxID=1871066 RepID=UPI000FEA63DB|nr:PIN domain-containing protein [Mesorhizobium sp.]RWB00412.1 MAG: hypothetical protein EOQ37_28300 [Mesorhizobium sp.]RWB08494.1 MAG: hypothetical protein EOQ39_35325 [Mesorhizobium sp.]
MPILKDDQIRALLTAEQIEALTIDTSIFDQKRLQLNSPPLQALSALKERPLSFILSSTVAKEVTGHLEKALEEAIRAAKKGIGEALFAFGTEKPTRDELIEQISGGQSTAEAANERFNTFLKETSCEVLDDTKLVDMSALFEEYFASRPPFGPGKKKNEFPDALALLALERAAADRDIGIMVVSKDGDWRAFCAKSERLYLVPEIEKALDLVNNAPSGLRKAVVSWMTEGGAGHEEVREHIAKNVELIEFTVLGYPTWGELEASSWGAELKTLEWPDPSDIDIIETELVSDGGIIKVVVSLPLQFTTQVSIELSFSIWDSVDKESVNVSSRSIEVNEEISGRLTMTVSVYEQGTEREEIIYEDSDLDIRDHEVDLGEIDVFEDDESWDGIEN